LINKCNIDFEGDALTNYGEGNVNQFPLQGLETFTLVIYKSGEILLVNHKCRGFHLLLFYTVLSFAVLN
jgi:hypothetical protein